jgi:hypothetical protein
MEEERPLRGDVSFVNQVFNMTTITCGNSFSTNCDVDYSTAHILLSPCRPERLVLSIPLLFADFLEKSFT